MVEPAVWLPSASGTMLAATAAAEPLEEPPGVCAGLCGLRVLPGEVGALGGDGLAHDHCACRASLRTTAASRAACAPCAARCRSRRHVAGVDDVLQADRYAVQRADRKPRALVLVGGARLPEGVLLVEESPGLHLRLDGADALEARLHELFRGEDACGYLPRGFRRRSAVRETARPSPYRP